MIEMQIPARAGYPVVTVEALMKFREGFNVPITITGDKETVAHRIARIDWVMDGRCSALLPEDEWGVTPSK